LNCPLLYFSLKPRNPIHVKTLKQWTALPRCASVYRCARRSSPLRAAQKGDLGRVHETLGISHAYPNRLNQRYQIAGVRLSFKSYCHMRFAILFDIP
jgi:hypothetical protein